MGQTKAQEKKRSQPGSAGRRGAKIAHYWSFRHHINMGRRAFRVYMQMRKWVGEARAKGLAEACAAAHPPEARVHLEKLLRARLQLELERGDEQAV